MSNLLHRLRDSVLRFKGTSRPDQFEARMNEEMRFHVDMLAEKKMRDGMTASEARRAALVEFGANERFREETRDEFRGSVVDDIRRDVRYALRTLWRSPLFTIVVVATLAIGIAANTALFSVYDQLILNPLTMPDPDSLLALVSINPQLSAGPVPSTAWTRYREIRSHNESFASIAITAFDTFTITGDGEPEQLNGLRVSASFFSTVGILPARGRSFSDEEDVSNGPAVCILSHDFWKARFASQEDVIGRTITLNGQPWQVVGIMPPRPSPPYRQVQVFAPRVFELSGLTPAQIENGASYAQTIARLKKGVSLEQARSELAAISRSYRERLGGKLDAANTTDAQLMITFLVGTLQPTFYTLLAAVGFVLLIACANVASLCLGRIVARYKEFAVRRSLGATRGRVVQQFLVESFMLSLMAGVIGTGLGRLSISAIQQLVSSQLPPNTVLTLSGRALAFTIGITAMTALLVGLIPALHASRTNVGEGLKDKMRGSIGQAGRFRAALIVAEVAMSVVLLVGSSLLLISFLKLQSTPAGFEPKGLATAFVSLPATRYKTPAQQAEFYSQVIDHLKSQPHVNGAAVAIGLPVSGFIPRSPYTVAGQPVLPLPQRSLAGLAIVSEDYFSVLQVKFLEGRAFTADDREGAPGVCIINESLAKKLFPGESALGKILLRGRDAEFKEEIVGVIKDVKTLGLNTPAPDEIYHPMRQLGRPGMAVVARTDGDPAALQATLRASVAAIDKNQAISFFATLENNVAASVGSQKVVAALTSIFAAVALLLSAVGLYSVLAYAVSRRTPEIGVRMALGAKPREVIGLVMRSGLRLVVIGLVLGLLGAAGASRLIQTLLFNVQPLDPLVYGAVVILFIVTAALACLVPSVRASRIDPLIALRAN